MNLSSKKYFLHTAENVTKYFLVFSHLLKKVHSFVFLQTQKHQYHMSSQMLTSLYFLISEENRTE